MLDLMTRKPDHRGVAARAAILRELRRRLDAGEPATVRALALALAMPPSTAGEHVATLRRAGMVTTRAGRYGGLGLTDAGRIATD